MKRIKKTKVIASALVAVALAGAGVYTVSNMVFIKKGGGLNPVYPAGLNNYGVKDACLAYKDGTYYVFASAFYEDEGRVRTHLLEVSTKDFKAFSKPLINRSGTDKGFIGLCSPDIAKHEDTYYLVYNSWGDKEGRPNRLFYATSKNLTDWVFDHPLAANLTDGKRAIDAAVHFMNGKVFLVYKEGQKMSFAVANRIDSGSWTPIESHVNAWYENYSFVEEQGRLYMTATDLFHNPVVLSYRGSAGDDSSFGKWKREKVLIAPKQGFNTDERANAASVAYIPEQKRFLLIYAGRTEHKSNAGRGNNQLALAQSKSLLTGWETL